jgi:hypothetical protein
VPTTTLKRKLTQTSGECFAISAKAEIATHFNDNSGSCAQSTKEATASASTTACANSELC